jgi:hypothetical protein
MDNNDSLFEIMNILQQHQDKNFVQRIQMPEGYPRLYDSARSFIEGPSTHSMAWGTDDQGNAYVYPTVVQPEKDKPLVRLRDAEAWDYAKMTGELIPFGKDHAKADWFSKAYKKVWDKK